MSDEIEIKGEREGVNLLARWLRGDDVRDYDRRKPTTTAESEAAFATYKTMLLVKLTEDEQADWDTQRQEGERD